MTSLFSKPKIKEPVKVPDALEPVSVEATSTGNSPAFSAPSGLAAFVSNRPAGTKRKAKTKKKTLLGI